MTTKPALDLPDIETLIRLADSIFADINLGLFVYRLEDPNTTESLRLIYANAAASKYTGSDMQAVVGKRIIEAFPNLRETEIPQTFAEVAREKAPRRLGTVEYGDDQLERRFYAVKAFPMPNACVGVAFEDISLRKQIDVKVKQRADELHRKYADLHQHTETIGQALRHHLDVLLETLGDRLTDEERRHAEALRAAAQQLADASESIRVAK